MSRATVAGVEVSTEHFIGGERVGSGATFTDLSPIDAEPLAEVARASRPWMMWSFLGLAVTGVPYMITYAMKQYYSPYFWFKMEVLVVAA